MQIRAFSKINLILQVLRKRPDGYHDLRSVMQSLALHDNLSIRRTTQSRTNQGRFTLACSDQSLPTDQRNLVTQAATYMINTYNITDDIHIDLEKHIPKGAGLGGGSSDCASTLAGINELFGLGIPASTMMQIGQKFGADVPFCLQGGTALAEGIGERLTPLTPHPHCWVVLACQMTEISTAEIYGSCTPNQTSTSKIPTMMQAIEAGDIKQIAANFYNDLQPVTAKMTNIQDIINIMSDQGAIGAAMSGSGPTVFGYFDNEETAKKATAYLDKITGRAILTEVIP